MLLERMAKSFGDPAFTWPFRVGLFAILAPVATMALAVVAVKVVGMSPSIAKWTLQVTLGVCAATATAQLTAVLVSIFKLVSKPHMRTKLNLIATAIALLSLAFLGMIGWAWRIQTNAL